MKTKLYFKAVNVCWILNWPTPGSFLVFSLLACTLHGATIVFMISDVMYEPGRGFIAENCDISTLSMHSQ